MNLVVRELPSADRVGERLKKVRWKRTAFRGLVTCNCSIQQLKAGPLVCDRISLAPQDPYFLAALLIGDAFSFFFLFLFPLYTAPPSFSLFASPFALARVRRRGNLAAIFVGGIHTEDGGAWSGGPSFCVINPAQLGMR